MKIEPYSQEISEIVTAELAEVLPFESFSEEEPFLKAYIQKEEYDSRRLKLALECMDYLDVKLSFSCRLIPPANWNAVWESDFEPIVVDGKCTVRAPFHKGLRRTRFNVVISPRMAFGTGHHQTTYMMCRALMNLESQIKGKVVMDMGCGTGVLAILAAKLGAVKVYGIDIDIVAARSAAANGRLNRLGKRVEFHYGDAARLQAGSYDLLLANINRNILLQDMDTYAISLKRGGRLMVSGFYIADRAMLVEAAAAKGLSLESEDELEGWCRLLFRCQPIL